MHARSSDEEPLTVGVIGAGKISTSCHLPVLANIDGVAVKYVADTDKDQARTVAKAYDAESVQVGTDRAQVPASDVALLAVPVGVREPYLEAFGNRSIPVFSEKPFASGIEEHRRFQAISETISCNYLRLCFSSTRQLRQLLTSGVFGELRRVRYAEGGIVGATGRPKENYQSDAALRGGGMLLERGCHGLSQLVYLLDEWDHTVEAVTIEWQDDFDVDVRARLVATGDGRSIPVEYALSRVRPLETTAEFVFEHGIAAFDPEDPDGRITVRGLDGGLGRDLAFEHDGRWATTFAQAAYCRWQEFLSLVRPGTETAGTPETMPAVTELISEMYDRSPPPAAKRDEGEVIEEESQ